MTNGEMIRKNLSEMSDHKLQEEFSDYICRKALESGLCTRHYNCYSCRMEWLKKEVNQNENMC